MEPIDIVSPAVTIDATAMITDVIGLDDVPDAFEALRTPSHQCKVIIDLSR